MSKMKRGELLLPLTQVLLKILKVININPKFHTVEEIAGALAAYYLQLSFYKLDPSTAYYYHEIENYVKDLQKPRRVAIDETKSNTPR